MPPRVRPENIEVDVWVDHPQKPGYITRKGGRPIGDVFAELTKRLDEVGRNDGPCYEYISMGHQFRDVPKAEWPRGETVVTLRMGGNEGYGLHLFCEQDVVDQFGRKTGVTQIPMGWVKLLTTRDDAFKLHRIVWDWFA